MGNFGIIYEIQLLGANTYKMRITPNYLENQVKSLLLYTNGLWKKYVINKRPDNSKFVDIKIIGDGSFKFLLPGGNCGDILFEILE